ncbi:MAG: acetyl-CoA carboxylase carboxyltransferase subunit alpha [Lachnospiraceae bacterium]|nr:acetyl-CoA carboxylase carboxyltransferase subunit alpha [Lachnospiraceae bacterium]MDY5520974.1 acetyl-CoA carboxylase carboxyltransferase subunit alpha [Agathobacter sp.]
MGIKDLFKKETNQPEPEVVETVVCPACKKELIKSTVVKKKYVCYECGHYFRVRAKNRIKMVADAGSFEAWGEELTTGNPLNFPEYEDKVAHTQEKTGLKEGVTIGKCTIYGEQTVLGVIDARFMMGSMGHVVGERITMAMERATEEKLPVILFCCSGGARMQEGIISLMQMAKTSGAVKRHSDAGLLYVPVLTDPTTGGVTASFAMLGDIILAEPKALIGFAGPRVIEQTIGQKLPEGFQRAEFQLEHGFVDAIVERENLKRTLFQILKAHRPSTGFANFDPLREDDSYEPTELMKERAAKAELLDAWDKVTAARQMNRLASVDYMDAIFDDFMELHGDRYFRDDPAIVGGIAYLDGQPVTVIGVHKGKDLKDCAARNYGMPSPEGYRKAIRLMKQAEKFGRPIITFVNTSGAYPGKEAEENGQGEAIARNLYEMSAIQVPILCLMIGEGGSGGALALAVGNEVWMMENATYSILSPEGFASILWKDGKRAKEAAGVMKITAQDLKELHVIEDIIPEFGGADEDALISIANYMKGNMKKFLKAQNGKSGQQLAQERYDRFRIF